MTGRRLALGLFLRSAKDVSRLRAGRRCPIGRSRLALLLAAAAIVACAPTAKLGQALLVDNFDDPASGRLPNDPAREGGYVDGEYSIKLAAGSGRTISLRPRFANVYIAVDARLVGDTETSPLGVSCGLGGPRAYSLIVSPGAGFAVLYAGDPHGSATVRRLGGAATRRGSERNHLELTCAGGRITARINGDEIGSVLDRFYAGGDVGLYVGRQGPQLVEARFDNLVVREAIVEP